jgi:hypothetical protein
MRHAYRLMAMGILAGSLALLPPGTAVSAATTTNGSSSVARVAAESDVHTTDSGRIYCNSYDECVTTRSNFARYYHVSSIYYMPPGSTCPSTCGGPLWYFDYWS